MLHLEVFEQSSTGSSNRNLAVQLTAHHAPCLGSLSKGFSRLLGCDLPQTDLRSDAVWPRFPNMSF